MRRINSPLSTPKRQNVATNNQSFEAKNRSPASEGSLTKKKKKSKIMIPTATFRGKLMPFNFTTLREIKRVQKTDKCLVPKKSFSRLVREIVQINNSGKYIRFQSMAMQCLQEATEIQMSLWFTKLNFLAGHTKRVTVTVPDSRLDIVLEQFK